jgi:hypothetical protein
MYSAKASKHTIRVEHIPQPIALQLIQMRGETTLAMREHGIWKMICKRLSLSVCNKPRSEAHTYAMKKAVFTQANL